MKFSLLIVMMCSLTYCWAQPSDLITFDSEGKLSYPKDIKGNRIPDFSYVGYHHGEIELPVVRVVKTIEPISGDNRIHIQNAINELEALKLDRHGFRGALLLKTGTYAISEAIYIKKSGIVIRGEGNATKLVATNRNKSDFIVFQGHSGIIEEASTRRKIIDDYVPVGTQELHVENGHDFEVGDRIIIERSPHQNWIDMLGMNDLSLTDANDSDWTPHGFVVKYKRRIVGLSTNKITFDAPIVDLIDRAFADGYVYKYNWEGRIEEVGIENIRLDSFYASEHDEDHAWNAVLFKNVENGWASRVTANYFTYSCVNIHNSSMKITVINCEMGNHKGKVTGGRMYSFNVNGQQNLVKNCITNGGRHDYVTGARVAGPNVFANCLADNANSDTGPHHRWAAGLLFDNVEVRGNDMNVRNRRNSGSGHGWSGVSCMFYNCKAENITIQDPPGDHSNWAIGCIANHTNKGCCGAEEETFGYVASENVPVMPKSLYEKQLSDRLSNSN